MFIQHGRKPAYRRANQVFTINCGGQQTSDVPAQLLNAPFFARVTNLFYDKQGSVSSDYVARTRGRGLRGDKPIKLLTYKNQLLCVGRRGIYRQDKIAKEPEDFKKIHSQLNVELEIFSIEKKENDVLFPCCAYIGHPQGNSGPELPNLKSGNVCLIAGYDTVAKAIVIKKYDLQNNKILSTATLNKDTIGIENSKVEYCQGLDLLYFKRGVGITEGYYLFMLYKGDTENNTKGKIRRFKIRENDVNEAVTIESGEDITPSQSMKDTLFIKAFGKRVYYFSWTNKETRPEKLSMDSVVWDDRIEGGTLQPEHIVLGRQNQGSVNTTRNFSGNFYHDFKPWYYGNIVKNQYIGPSAVIPKNIPKLIVTWSPQVGYYILSNESDAAHFTNIVAHFHADRTPLEDEMIAEGSDIPKMSYSGSSFIYFKPNPNGDYYENSRGELQRDPISGGVEEPGKINRYSPAWFFPVLSAGQTETEVSAIDTPQEDNLIVPPVFTGIRRPLGIDLVQVCFGCLRPGAQEINGQMIMGGGTLNYYDGQKVVERGFAERPKIEIVKNPSPWMHDTTNYVDISNEIASVPDSEKTELQYTSEKKSSLYTEHDPTSPWQIAVPAEDGPAIHISGDSPDLKTAVGQDSSIGLGSLKFSSPASAGGAQAVEGYRSITLNLSSYSKENLGSDILPKAIVINNKLYRFQQEVINNNNTADLIAYTRDNPFAGFAEGNMISLYIPQCFQYKNNAQLDAVLTEEITVDETLSTGKEVTLRDSVYQRFVQKGPGTSFRDLAPRLLNDINAPMDVTQIGISHFDDNVFWSLYLEDEVGQEDGLAEALVGIGGGNTANIERDINRQNRDRRPSFNNNVLDEVNGDGGDIVGFLYRVLDINDVDNPYQLYAVVDESRAGVDFADWVDKNNISRIVLQGTQGTITIQGGEIDTEPQGSFGLGNKYKIYQLSDRTDFGQFIGGVGPNNFYKIYKGRTEIDTDEGNVIPRGTYYFQTYENTANGSLSNNKVPLGR